jgi:acetyltransferase-like isoleucine patch superfamily enzyme
MSLDATKIGQVVAEQMEALEARFGDDCQIGDVCTIVEVLGPHGSSVAVRPGADVRPHGLIGLLRMAERIALNDVQTESSEDE